MLITLTNNCLEHPGDAWCNLQHQAQECKKSKMAEILKQAVKLGHGTTIFGFSTSQNASIYLLSLCSNSTICRSTHGKTCELVSRTRERSSLRPENPETLKSSASVLKNMVTYPPPNPYISETAFSHRFQKVYTYPPQVTTCLHIEAKVVEIAEKCQNPQSWKVLNVPERYAVVPPTSCESHIRMGEPPGSPDG